VPLEVRGKVTRFWIEFRGLDGVERAGAGRSFTALAVAISRLPKNQAH